MSWSIKIIGTRDNVKAAVAKETNLPINLKDVITSFINAGSTNETAKAQTYYCDGIVLESVGHYGPDDTWSGITSLSVTPVQLAAAPAA